MTIQAGNEAVSVMLDEAPTIQVDMADCSVVKQNDRIAVTRGKMFAGQLGVAQAQEMTIELAEPLTSVKKRPVRQPPTSSSRRSNNAEPAPFNPNGGRSKMTACVGHVSNVPGHVSNVPIRGPRFPSCLARWKRAPRPHRSAPRPRCRYRHTTIQPLARSDPATTHVAAAVADPRRAKSAPARRNPAARNDPTSSPWVKVCRYILRNAAVVEELVAPLDLAAEQPRGASAAAASGGRRGSKQVVPEVVDVDDEQAAGLEDPPDVLQASCAVRPAANHAQRAEQADRVVGRARRGDSPDRPGWPCSTVDRQLFGSGLFGRRSSSIGRERSTARPRKPRRARAPGPDRCRSPGRRPGPVGKNGEPAPARRTRRAGSRRNSRRTRSAMWSAWVYSHTPPGTPGEAATRVDRWRMAIDMTQLVGEVAGDRFPVGPK